MYSNIYIVLLIYLFLWFH